MARPTAILYCEIRRSLDHWIRIRALVEALHPSYAITVVLTADRADVSVPEGVDLITFREGTHYPCNTGEGEPRLAPGGQLIALLDRVRPSLVVVEHFPFGREKSALYMVPFLQAARRLPNRPLVVTSLRDIGERPLPDQDTFDRRVVLGVNRLLDAVLVHADPRVMTLGDTFALADQIAVPVHPTGYLAPAAPPAATRDTSRAPRIVVAGGDGRLAMPVFRAALAAQRDAGLAETFEMRIIGDALIDAASWREIEDGAREVPRVEVRREVPSLAAEMAEAAVSVSRAGYGTLVEAVRARVPAVVVPFVEPGEDEQQCRARRFAEIGAVRALPEAGLTPARLAAAIRGAAGQPPFVTVGEIDFDGARRTAAIIADLAASRSSARPS